MEEIFASCKRMAAVVYCSHVFYRAIGKTTAHCRMYIWDAAKYVRGAVKHVRGVQRDEDEENGRNNV